METMEFRAETRKVLDLMIHSLYQHREIFLRELISNASDAMDKRRYESLTRHDLAPREDDYVIRIAVDKSARTLEISDAGIGMTREELIENIGTIARSGTQEFLKAIREKPDAAAGGDLIGQFGVGFYSAFMVAEEVVVVTRHAGGGKDAKPSREPQEAASSRDEENAWRWESRGDGNFSIGEATRDSAGTTVTLRLKPPEEGEEDFTEPFILRKIVKKYSDFIAYPILLTAEGKSDEEPLNARKTLWSRKPAEVKEEEYAEFYKHVAHDWNPPFKTIHFSAEGLIEYQALLFLPERPPFDLFTPHGRHGIHLYAKRVFIMDDCRDLAPEYLRFVRGVVDCADISLNISRETVQRDRQITQIRKRLAKKILDTLKEMKDGERERYEQFWRSFGRVLKEGLLSDPENVERLRELILFETTEAREKLFSLAEYAARMKPGQEKIYYLTGETRAALETSPHLEALRARGYEVLLLTDPVDDMAVSHLEEYDGRKLESASKGEREAPVADDAEKKSREAAAERMKGLMEWLAEKLKEEVKAVRVSERLTESAACLVTDETELPAHLEKLLRQHGQEISSSKRTLEVNPRHPLLEKMRGMFERDRSSEKLSLFADLLYSQAAVAEGVTLQDPNRFARQVAALMAEGE